MCIVNLVGASKNKNAVKASYEVCKLIAKTGKPHTIGEGLILSAVKAIVKTMLGEKAAKELNILSLSNDTVKRRIDKISDNIKVNLLVRIRKSQYYSLQLDESTDCINKSWLFCYIRYEFENNIYEDIILPQCDP